MSQYPRRVACAGLYTTYTWDGVTWNLRRGAVLDVPPGSALETAIGAGNLSAVIPVASRGQGDDLSRGAQAN